MNKYSGFYYLFETKDFEGAVQEFKSVSGITDLKAFLESDFKTFQKHDVPKEELSTRGLSKAFPILKREKLLSVDHDTLPSKIELGNTLLDLMRISVILTRKRQLYLAHKRKEKVESFADLLHYTPRGDIFTTVVVKIARKITTMKVHDPEVSWYNVTKRENPPYSLMPVEILEILSASMTYFLRCTGLKDFLTHVYPGGHGATYQTMLVRNFVDKSPLDYFRLMGNRFMNGTTLSSEHFYRFFLDYAEKTPELYRSLLHVSLDTEHYKDLLLRAFRHDPTILNPFGMVTINKYVSGWKRTSFNYLLEVLDEPEFIASLIKEGLKVHPLALSLLYNNVTFFGHPRNRHCPMVFFQQPGGRECKLGDKSPCEAVPLRERHYDIEKVAKTVQLLIDNGAQVSMCGFVTTYDGMFETISYLRALTQYELHPSIYRVIVKNTPMSELVKPMEMHLDYETRFVTLMTYTSLSDMYDYFMLLWERGVDPSISCRDAAIRYHGERPDNPYVDELWVNAEQCIHDSSNLPSFFRRELGEDPDNETMWFHYNLLTQPTSLKNSILRQLKGNDADLSLTPSSFQNY